MLSTLRRDQATDANAASDPAGQQAAAASAPTQSPGSGVLTPSLQAQLEVLAKGLTREQALWISGYFAGLGGLGAAELTMPHGVPGESASQAVTITLLYGSETGNSAHLAENFASRLRGEGFNVAVSDMETYKPRQLKEEQYLLLVASTHGEGDPPQAALNFFEFIESRKAPKLPGLKFSVLALGDSTYEKYCEAGKRLDRRFEELGATRLSPRVDCDVDFDVPSTHWMDALQPLLPKAESTPRQSGNAAPFVQGATAAMPSFDKRHPFSAPVIENLVLTGRGSSKETRHIELSLEGADLTYEPGDALGLFPANDIDAVQALLEQAGLDGETGVMRGDKETSLAEALTSDFEIQTATPRFLENWARLSGASELEWLIAPENASKRNAFLHGHHVIDIVRTFPVSGLASADLLAGLRPLQPRLYSIASSLSAVPDEVHLTIASVIYELHGKLRMGIASGHIAARLEPDSTLPVYVQPNPHFRLPADDAPIIMIGAGTGVAPYRAFLQEREARGAVGRSWLFFGERNFRTDFLYQTEWQAYLQNGLLTRMNVAFSRDRAEKTYVQHKISENGADVFAWLEEGAHLYVCGDAAHMAPDVHAALLNVIETHGHLGPEAAEEYLRNLQRDHRYQRDVY